MIIVTVRRPKTSHALPVWLSLWQVSPYHLIDTVTHELKLIYLEAYSKELVGADQIFMYSLTPSY